MMWDSLSVDRAVIQSVILVRLLFFFFFFQTCHQVTMNYKHLFWKTNMWSFYIIFILWWTVHKCIELQKTSTNIHQRPMFLLGNDPKSPSEAKAPPAKTGSPWGATADWDELWRWPNCCIIWNGDSMVDGKDDFWMMFHLKWWRK